MGVNDGGQGDESPRNLEWLGEANANSPPRFCVVSKSKFEARDCLNYNAIKSLPTP